MRIGTFALLVSCLPCLAAPSNAQDLQPDPPLTFALRFFDRMAAADTDMVLRALRTRPLSEWGRDLIRATLPPSGELAPTPDERKKLNALQAVLIYHERQHVFDIKVIDVPQAVIGLHGRAILLISRPALTVLSASEVKALAAHEVGHDFFWEEFQQAQRSSDSQARQRLELKCDVVATLTLLELGLDPMRLPAALEKLERFNKRFGVAAHAADYPILEDRERLVTAVLRQRAFGGGRSATRR